MVHVFIHTRATGLAPQVTATAWMLGVTFYANDGAHVLEYSQNVMIPFTLDSGDFNLELEAQAVGWVRKQTQFGWQAGAIKLFYQPFTEADA